MILLDAKETTCVSTMNMDQFHAKFKIMDAKSEIQARNDIYYSKKYYFYLKYFADGDDCCLVEIRPKHIDIKPMISAFLIVKISPSTP